jgi:hypothetical protein
MCIQAKEEVHLRQGMVVALLRIVLQYEAGSLAEHKCRGSTQASAGQCNEDVRFFLRLESLLA